MNKWKRINQILNIAIGSFLGVWVGNLLYTYWHYRNYPDLYAMQSAPWYTSPYILVFPTIIIVVILLIIKFIIRKKLK